LIALDALLELIEQSQRSAGAPRLAEKVGATHLCVFIRDPEFGRFLPALGFPQRLPDGLAWQSFLAGVAEGSQTQASLISPFTARPTQVSARLITPDTLSVLFGERSLSEAHTLLAPALRLSGALYLEEMRTSLSEVGAALARRTAQESRKAAAALHGVHEQLASALHHTRQLATHIHRDQQQLDLACRIAGLGAWEMDAATRIVTLSPPAAAILGLPADPSHHHLNALLRAVHTEDRRPVEDAIASMLLSSGEHSVRFRLLSAPGSLRDLELLGMLFESAQKDSRAIVGFLRQLPQQQREAGSSPEHLNRAF
jgi:PAS domain-containing protein